MSCFRLIRRVSHVYLLLAASLLLIVSPLQAQNGKVEGEFLQAPVAIPSDKGAFKGLKDLPESIRKSKIFARDLYRLRSRVTNDSEYSLDQYLQSYESAKRQQEIQLRAQQGKGQRAPLADAWTNIGPTGSGVLTGGMTAALAINPKQPSTIYAGAGGGGVWKSYNNGLSWVPLTDNVIPALAIASIAIDPVDTNVIYAATGNPYYSVRDLDGNGLYKSTNAGATWRRIGSTVLKGNMAKVFVHPKQPNIVLASGHDQSRGIYISTNSGTDWSVAYSATSGTVWDITAANVINNDVVLYMVHGNSGSSTTGGVYKSITNGRTWVKVSTGLPAGNEFGKSAIAISPRAPDKVWVLVSTPGGDWKGLYRSTNAGQSFTLNSSAPSTLFKPVGLNNAQGWYDLCIAMTTNSQAGPDTVLIGGIEGWYTHNSGQTWEQFAGYSDVPPSAPHVDLHTIVIHPTITQRAFLGTDGGIYFTQIGGISWTARVGNYITHRYYRLGLQNNDSKTTWAGAQDQGVWKHTVGSSSSFRGLGDAFQIAVNPQNVAEVYALAPNGDIWRSTNSGTAGSFSPVSSSQFDDGADWDAPFKIGNKSPFTRYVGRAKLWKSNDGINWTAAGNAGFSNSNPIRSIAINPYNNNVIYVGGDAKVKLTTNGGTNWLDKSTGVGTEVVTSIQTPGSDPGFVVISLVASGTKARVLRSTDSGRTWTNVSGTGSNALPNVTCWALALDSLSPRTTWYAATDNGMYYTTNGGQAWSVAGSGIGLTPCWDVALHSNKATLRVATFGRGIWEANTNILPVEISSLSAIPHATNTELRWTTDSERNTLGFHVRRSFNYSEFEEIGFVEAAGNSDTRRDYTFLDPKTDTGSYLYQLRVVDLDGSESFSNFVEVHRGDENDRLRLDQNYPNPFLASEAATATPTRIRYYLKDEGHVTLKIFNAAGQLVQILVDEYQPRGEKNVFWRGVDRESKLVSGGTYFYVLETSSGEQLWSKMIVLD